MEDIKNKTPDVMTEAHMEKLIAQAVITAKSLGVDAAVKEIADIFEIDGIPSIELEQLRTALTNILNRAQTNMETALYRYLNS